MGRKLILKPRCHYRKKAQEWYRHLPHKWGHKTMPRISQVFNTVPKALPFIIIRTNVCDPWHQAISNRTTAKMPVPQTASTTNRPGQGVIQAWEQLQTPSTWTRTWWGNPSKSPNQDLPFQTSSTITIIAMKGAGVRNKYF